MKRLKFLAMMIAISCLAFTACSDDDDENGGEVRFSISSSTVALQLGQKDTLTCSFYPEDLADKTVTWTTSDANVATVENGVITAVGEGTATVTATPAANPAEAKTCAVSVVEHVETVSGEVSGTWSAYTTYMVNGQINVPEGQSLTIEEGVQVIFNGDDGTGTGTGIEFFINGNIYCNGTEDAPVLFSVAEIQRTDANWIGAQNLWGGIFLNNKSDNAEALFSHCQIEYVGSPVTDHSQSYNEGIYTPGEDWGVQITAAPDFKGSLVVENCVFNNGNADAIYMQNGKAIITHNTFYCNGATGGEAVNVKAGTTTTVAYNVMYSPNTNGLKLSASGQNDEAGRHQSLCAAYNNTIVNAGWRRDGEKGGCVYVEKNILANVFNNLMVNCKFRAQAPSWGNPSADDGCDLKSVINYNCYVSGNVTSNFAQDQEEGGIKTPYAGYTSDNKNYTDAIDQNCIITEEDGAVAFVNFPLDNALDNVKYDSSWDFTATTLPDGATDDATLAHLSNSSYDMDYVNTGLTLNGTVYKAPAPGRFFGAYAAE